VKETVMIPLLLIGAAVRGHFRRDVPVGPGVQDAQWGTAPLGLLEGVGRRVRVGVAAQPQRDLAVLVAPVVAAHHRQGAVGVPGQTQTHRAEQQPGDPAEPAVAHDGEDHAVALAQQRLHRAALGRRGHDQQAGMAGADPRGCRRRHGPGLVQVGDGMDEAQGGTTAFRLPHRPVQGPYGGQ